MYRLIFAFLGSLCLFAASPRTPEQTLREAIRLHQAGDAEAAIPLYEEFLKQRPDAIPIRSNLGAAFARVGRYGDAIAQYRLAVDKDPRNWQIWLNLGLAYHKANDIEKAAETFEIVRALEPGNPSAVLLLSDCELRRGNNKKVIELLKPFESQLGEDRAFSYLLGTALIRDNRAAEGQVIVDKVLRGGDSAEARLLLGTARLMSYDNAEALKDLAKAVELNAKLPEANAYYGLGLLTAGEVAAAEAAFRRELQNNPNDFTANLELGVIARNNQKWDEAGVFFKRALEIRPSDPGVRYQLARLELSRNEFESARNRLEELIKQYPEFIEAHVSLATVYYRLKRKEDGDRERAIVQKLNAAKQAREPKGNASE